MSLASTSGLPNETAEKKLDEENNNEEDEENDDEDFELFFTDPQQLLDIFLELEEQNLSLIQNSQDTEEALEELKQTINRSKIKMERETEMLRRQIDALNEEIRREEEREAELKIKASYFNYGEFKAEEQDKMLKELNKKVYLEYISCLSTLNDVVVGTYRLVVERSKRSTRIVLARTKPT